MPLPPPSHRHYTPRRPWAPLTDAAWAAIEPHLRAVTPHQGRPLADARGRIDAMFLIAASGQPWRCLPEAYGRPDTVSRHFRRLAQAGLWMRLLAACAAPGAPPVLRRIEFFLVRAARRAMRVLGLPAAEAAERLGLLSAMPVLPMYLCRPVLFRWAEAWLHALLLRHRADPFALPRRRARLWLKVMRFYAGKPWHRRWAEP
jgi:transposase